MRRPERLAQPNCRVISCLPSLDDFRLPHDHPSTHAAVDQTRDRFHQNVRLMEALTKKGYDVNYAWGMNRHGQALGGAILPEMRRWLWRDQPASTDPRDMVERSFRAPAEKKRSPSGWSG
jgi:hypothetical protein